MDSGGVDSGIDESDRFIKHRNNPRSFKRWMSMDLPKWANASCSDKDPELFFIERYETRKIPVAKEICAGCKIRIECLGYALKWKIPHGIWGGTTPKERHYLVRSLQGNDFSFNYRTSAQLERQTR